MVDENKPSSAPPVHQRQMKNFLIDKNYQLGWVARVAAVTLLVVGGLGFFLYNTLAESIDIVTSSMVPAMTEQAAQELTLRGDSHKLAVVYSLAGSLLALVVALSVMTIIVTHKVAGPIYKMRRLLSEINGDRLWLQEKLRKGDELQNVFTEFSNMLSRLRESRKVDIEALEKAVAVLGQQRADEEQIHAIKQLLERYRSSVGMN